MTSDRQFANLDGPTIESEICPCVDRVGAMEPQCLQFGHC